MNNTYKILAALLFSAFSLSSYAKDKPMKMGTGMGMTEEMKDKMARDKQIYILKINALSDQIHDETNAQKKQALLDEQLQLIKAHQEEKRQRKQKMMKKHHQQMMNKK